ncbi:hypothetical protein [Candidatus Viridilinea mediisalina]|uniref:Uncharacterized protein n=1 Tax=Candidatus Viridilinea mediisalina TaxID=2024553 RepID=A0A2A6RFP3_9CHLR|nr:hypothetical protein [Candidatus Viridilinea mediisalina]PDW01706.1 hypothetical protein CJ255_17770 [Candidatus Viridilinea mediisalina]
MDVFLFLVGHNALKESTGLDAALKPLFKTRLVGNVDQATWTALVGPGIKLRGIPDAQGIWHHPDKRGTVFEIRIQRPTAHNLNWMSQRPAPTWPSILDAARALRVPDLPNDGAEPASPGPWVPSELHQQVQAIVAAELPEIRRLLREEGVSLVKAQELTRTSNRALARRIGLGGNGGSAAVRVRDLIAEWEQRGGVRLFEVEEATAAPVPAVLMSGVGCIWPECEGNH